MCVKIVWLLVILPLNTFKYASGLRFNVTSNQVVVDDSGTLTLICSVNESDVYSIFITRVLPPRYDKDEFVASFIFETAALGDQITDDKRLPGTEVKHGSVNLYRAKLTCSEAKRYRCFYTNSSSREREITLQVLVLPQMIPPLQARKIGTFVEDETTSDRVVFKVGDELKVQCTANIGSIMNTTIRWRKTSEVSSGKLIEYQPPDGTYDEGTPLSDNQCGFTRTASIRYNVTTADTLYDLAFECYVSVSGYPSTTLTPSGVFTTTNNLRYHVDMYSVPSCESSTNVAAFLGVATGSVVTTLTIVSIFVVFTKFFRDRHKQTEEARMDNHKFTVSARVLPLATRAEYEDLKENTRDKNAYSHLNTEQN